MPWLLLSSSRVQDITREQRMFPRSVEVRVLLCALDLFRRGAHRCLQGKCAAACGRRPPAWMMGVPTARRPESWGAERVATTSKTTFARRSSRGESMIRVTQRRTAAGDVGQRPASAGLGGVVPVSGGKRRTGLPGAGDDGALHAVGAAATTALAIPTNPRPATAAQGPPRATQQRGTPPRSRCCSRPVSPSGGRWC